MKSRNYRVVYDYPYSRATTFSELNGIKAECLKETVLCAGGAAVNSDNLLLVSCGNCLSVLTPTPQNKPVFNNGAYWRLTNAYSFGFSPTYNINQNRNDVFDCAGSNCPDIKRLSWYLYQNIDGFRLGKLTNKVTGALTNYRKLVFLK